MMQLFPITCLELAHLCVSTQVLLDDGQQLELDSEKRFVTVSKYREIFAGDDPPPVPPIHVSRMNARKQSAVVQSNKQQMTCSRPFDDKVEVTATKDHFLVGRKLCLSWTDLKGRTREVDGDVMECNKQVSSGDVLSFTVVCSSQSRDCVNSISNDVGATVPESQTLPPPLVLGGCIAYEQRTSVTNTSILLRDVGDMLPYWKWITPDDRHQEQILNDEGKLLPRVTLDVGSYRLQLNVKKSTIPNAGYGVFLSCRPLEQKDRSIKPVPFLLRAGKLVDCGIYAPFRVQDKKVEAVFFAKNFIHSHKCEEWAFTAGDSRYQYDITDDVTGDIHELARMHIPAYVNESNNESCVCIRAEHSPDTNVHYLLGHAFSAQGDFVVPSDGTEMEVFVNYGEGYEEVRVRKGYSFLPHGEKKSYFLNVIANEDIVDIQEMDRFGVVEIQACVTFFSELLFSNKSKLSKIVLRRSLTCMVVLHHRMWRIFLENNDEKCDVKDSLELASAKVLGVLLDMIDGDESDELKRLYSAGNVDGLFHRTLELQFSCEELAKLSDMLMA